MIRMAGDPILVDHQHQLNAVGVIVQYRAQLLQRHVCKASVGMVADRRHFNAQNFGCGPKLLLTQPRQVRHGPLPR